MLGLLVVLMVPANAEAHGPTNPVASNYLARVTRTPAALTVRVIDGDQAIWVRAPASGALIVIDPRGAPYLRFSRAGVSVNTNSELYYLNQIPVAQPPPPGLTRRTPAVWQRVSAGHSYTWHEGRLHAPATLAVPTSGAYVGSFRIPIIVVGSPAVVSGGVWYRGAPSIMWFWPVAVLLVCLLAVRRLRDPRLDRAAAAWLAATVLIGVTLATLARNLHGRPNVSAFGIAELILTLAFVGWGLRRLARRRVGFMTSFALAFVALWEGITLLPTLTHGYVLLALPAFLARLSAVLCLGGGLGLLLVSVPVAQAPDPEPPAPESDESLDLVSGVD